MIAGLAMKLWTLRWMIEYFLKGLQLDGSYYVGVHEGWLAF